MMQPVSPVHGCLGLREIRAYMVILAWQWQQGIYCAWPCITAINQQLYHTVVMV